MRVLVSCLLLHVSFCCPQVPNASLPVEALQDCGSENSSDGELCRFNCSNGLSHSGRLVCSGGDWQEDPSDPPRCLAACWGGPAEGAFGASVEFLGYDPGFWAAPTSPSTTTTPAPLCDTAAAQECLQSVVAVSDIQVFCQRLPTSVECLKAVSCCTVAADTIRGSIDSCLNEGVEVANACSAGDSCGSSCLSALPSSVAQLTNASCLELQRAPACLKSASCCSRSIELQPYLEACGVLGIHIPDACATSALPAYSNEGARYRVSCQSPRVPGVGSPANAEYVCTNSSYVSPDSVSCVDVPCSLNPHPQGVYNCWRDSLPIVVLQVAGELQVPQGAQCSLQCSENYLTPSPNSLLRCTYVEGNFPDIMYLDQDPSPTAAPRMVQRPMSSQTFGILQQQVCIPINCTLPEMLDGVPVALTGQTSSLVSIRANVQHIECEGIAYDAVCRPVCAPGFVAEAEIFRCAASGSFEGAISCRAQSCPVPPAPSVGTLLSCGSKQGDLCEVLCPAGYFNNASYKCEEGTWQAPSAPCAERRCTEIPRLANTNLSLEACADQPSGYQCPVSCLAGYTLQGQVTCERGAYVQSGLGCVSSAAGSTRSQVVLGKWTSVSSSATSLRGRAGAAVHAALTLDSELTAFGLGVQMAAEFAWGDLPLALLADSLLPPHLALRSAAVVAAALSAANSSFSDVSVSLLELALYHLDMDSAWSNFSLGLSLASVDRINALLSSGISGLSPRQQMQTRAVRAAEQPGAAAVAASGISAVDAERLALRGIFDGALWANVSPHSAAQDAAFAQTAVRGLELKELGLLRLFLQPSLRSATNLASISQRLARLAHIATELGNLEGYFSAGSAPAQLAAVYAVGLEFGLTEVEAQELVAATAWHVYSTPCTDTQLRCLPQRLLALSRAGRSVANLAKGGRPGFPAACSAVAAQAAARASRLSSEDAVLAAAAAAMASQGLRVEDLAHLSDQPKQLASARRLGLTSQAEVVVQRLLSYTVTGLELGLQLGADLTAQLTPQDGELSVHWAMTTLDKGEESAYGTAAIVRAMLSGASRNALSAAYNSAAQVPSGSRSPVSVATSVLVAVPELQAEESCRVTRAVAAFLGLSRAEAAQSGALATGIDLVVFAQVAQLSLEAPSPATLAAAVAPFLPGASGMQQVSLAFGAALAHGLGLQEALEAALLSLPPPRSARDLLVLAPLAHCAGAWLWELAPALVTHLPSDPLADAKVLAQAAKAMGEEGSGPIFQVTVLQSAVALSNRRTQGDIGPFLTRFSFPTSATASVVGHRAAQAFQGDVGALAQEVVQLLAAEGAGSVDLKELAAAAYFAAIGAGLNASMAATTVYAAVGQQSPALASAAGLLAATWPSRPGTGSTSAAEATSAVLQAFASAEASLDGCSDTSGANATTCAPRPDQSCGLQVSLAAGLNCQSFCQSASFAPQQCLSFAFGTCASEDVPLDCNYTVTDQDLSTYSSALCVCSGARRGVYAAAEHANRLARLSEDMETLSFLGQRAFEVMPPLRALEATVAYIHQDAEGIAQLAISAVSREGLNFSTWQAAYAAFSLAGHNTSFAIAAAVEAVKQLGGHRDQAIALMPDILLLNGLSQAEARMELVSFALLPAALEALAQAFQRFELFREGWQAERYAILTDFEGEANAMYTSLREAQKAFQSPSAAVAAALANGEASQLLRYLIASGYSSQQALQLMAQADNASLQEAGAQLSSSLRLGFLHPPLSVEWLTPGATSGPAVLLEEAQQVSVLESLAAALEVAPAKVILWPASGAVSSSSATSTTARRLAEESVATCSFNLVIDDASARVLDLTTGTEPYRVFLARLSEALAVAQLPMPSCFRDPKMGVENVKVEDNFELAESVWVAKSDWSECPAKCGKAWQSRSVACSTSNEFACNASGAKLATEQSCEKYVDCKWEWTCPFSRSASVTCGVQLLLTGVAGFAALLLLWCCLHMLRQCCKWAPKMGEMALMTKSGEQMKVNFYIVGAQSRQGQGTEVDKEATMLDSVWGPEKTGEKCHVVWDVDPEQAAQLEFTKATMQRLGGPVNEQQQQVLERLPEVLGKPAQAVYNTRSMLREQRQEANQQMELQRMASMAHQAMSTNRSGAIPPVQEDIGPELAFHTGDRVEYFSTSHCRWTGALVDDATNSSFIIQLTPHYQPNDKNQKRLDVQIEHLRRPLWEGELVSVYVASLKTWERGVIYGKQHASVTVVGYKVQILGARARILNSVPAHFVWRRFETDMAVEVYDLDLGWRSGKVLWDAEMNELAQEEIKWFDVMVVFDEGDMEEVSASRVRRAAVKF